MLIINYSIIKGLAIITMQTYYPTWLNQYWRHIVKFILNKLLIYIYVWIYIFFLHTLFITVMIAVREMTIFLVAKSNTTKAAGNAKMKPWYITFTICSPADQCIQSLPYNHIHWTSKPTLEINHSRIRYNCIIYQHHASTQTPGSELDVLPTAAEPEI